MKMFFHNRMITPSQFIFRKILNIFLGDDENGKIKKTDVRTDRKLDS